MTGEHQTDRNVGVILCNCRGTLDASLDLPRLRAGLDSAEGVGAVKVCSQLCEPGECTKTATAMLKDGAERLVAAGCDAETLGTAMDGALRAGKLDSGLWWSVDLRGSDKAPGGRDAATNRALDRLIAAVDRVRKSKSLKPVKTEASRDVAVFGGGVAGMQSALALADLGHNVALVWRDKDLGGMTATMPELFGHIAPDADEATAAVRDTVARLVQGVSAHGNVSLLPETEVKSVTGEAGNFSLQLVSGSGGKSLRVGAIVLATGGATQPQPPVPASVLDLPALVAALRTGKPPRRIAVVIDEYGEQSSTVSFEVFSVAERLVKDSGTQVTVFCKHARVAATGIEALYRRARAAGVVVVKSLLPVSVNASATEAKVAYRDPLTGRSVEETFDVVAMADRRPAKGIAGPASAIGQLRPGPDGAMQYDNAWLLPVQTNLPGVFVVGGGRGNSEYREALTDGLAVASQIHALLGDGWIKGYDDAAAVDAEKCVLCLTCRRICPHGAIGIDDELSVARVSVVACQRCGMCAAECPARAISLPRFTDAEVDADVGGGGNVTVFACENSAIPAANSGVGVMAADARVVRVPCAGKVDPRMVLAALEKGASKVMVLGCHPGNCRYLSGSSRAAKRMARLNAMLEKAGVDRSRVVFKGIAAVEPARFTEYVTAQPSAQ